MTTKIPAAVTNLTKTFILFLLAPNVQEQSPPTNPESHEKFYKETEW